MKPYTHPILLFLLALLLVSCGGGESNTARRGPLYAAGTEAVSAADYHNVVQHIYVGYFGRPADAGGLAYFAQRFLAAGAPLGIVEMSRAYASNPDARALMDVFGTSKESNDMYAGDNGVFMDAVYRNLFGRAPDAAGKAYWVGAINTGAMTRASAAVNVMAGAQSTDIDIITRKSRAAANFTAALNTAERRRAYDGLSANAIVRNMLATVNLATDLLAFQNTIETTLKGLVAKLPPPAQGLYAGMLTNGSAFHLLVLDDDRYWGLYGSASGGMLRPFGFIEGQGYSGNGSFRSSDMKDFWASPATPGSVASSYAAHASITGTVTAPEGTVDFSNPVIATSTYNYEAAPALADIAGSWRLSGPNSALYTFVVAPDGAFSGTTTACTYSGSLKPRAAGKNLFESSWTFNEGACRLSGQAARGVAFSYLINDGATRELLVTGINANRSAGTVLFGWSATAAGQPADFKATDTVEGTGAEAVSGSAISVHYTGWLYSSETANLRSAKFDSSHDRGTPFNFTLGIGSVIAGWDRGVVGMKVGGKRTLVVPANLGYGSTGNASIPPNAGMVFDVELVTVFK